MLSPKVQELFNEPACDKNASKDEKARKKGCSKPLTPGAAAGGCAFDGAKIVLQPITDVAHLVHAPLACEGNSWDNRGAASSGPMLWRTSFTTDLSELDVVMGQGERKLYKAIREIVEAHAPPAVFVYETCVMEEGWSRAVVAMIDGITDRLPAGRNARRIAVLPGCNQTVGDIEEIRETIEAFGLEATILPDVSGSLDGTVPGRWIPTTYGGTAVEDIRTLGECVHCIAIGEAQRAAAEKLAEVCDVPYTLFGSLTGLKAADRFVTALSEISGRPVPAKLRRQRSQLSDALLDGHFHFGGKKIAIAAEPDHLYQLAMFFTGMGAEIHCAVTTTGGSPILRKVPVDEVRVGDLGDLETYAAGADLLVTHSHGRQASERIGIPLMRVGFPIFDRLGAQHAKFVGWRGTRELVFEAANIFQAHLTEPTPQGLNPLLKRENDHDSRSEIVAHIH